MRKMLAWITVMALLFGGCAGRDPLEAGGYPEMTDREAEAWIAGSSWEGESLELQRRLVRWYGICLEQEKTDPGLPEAYQSILAGPGGVMGWLRFPESDVILPLLHDGDAGDGFIHSASSHFPTGDGGLTVLTLQGADARRLLPKAGEMFEIHILDKKLLYQITDVEPGVPLEETLGEACLLVFALPEGRVTATGVPVYE